MCIRDRNQAEAIIHQTEKQLEELGDKIPADKRAPIQEAVAKLKEAHKNSDLAGIEAAIKDIERTFGAAQQDILNAQAQAQQAAGGAQGYANPGASAGNQGDDHVTDVDFEEVK